MADHNSSAEFDLIVVGAGYAGCACALACARGGLRVVIVAENGGPAGGLLTGALAVANLREGGDAAESWEQAHARRAAASAATAAEIGQQLAAAGVTCLAGRGRLDGPGRVVVSEPDGRDHVVAAGRVVLATGSAPASLPGVATDGIRVLTSDHLLAGAQPGRSLIIAGGGPTGVELAGLCKDLGSEVILVEMRERILPAEDDESAAVVQAALITDGVGVLTGHRVIGAAVGPQGVVVTLLNVAAKAETTRQADTLLLALGRRPLSRDLGLDTAVVETDRLGHVLVDGNAETSTRGLYALGDLLATPRTADAALREARAAASHILGTPVAPLRWRQLPAWVSSRPELASLGLTHPQALAEGRLADVVRAGGARVVVDRESGAFLGLHATGTGAIGLVRGAAALLTPAGAARPDPDLLPAPAPADLAAAGAVLRAAGVPIPVD